MIYVDPDIKFFMMDFLEMYKNKKRLTMSGWDFYNDNDKSLGEFDDLFLVMNGGVILRDNNINFIEDWDEDWDE